MIEPVKTFRTLSERNKWHWTNTIDSEMFHAAVTTALTEMDLRNTAPPDMASAASWQWRREGAKQFIGILMGLMDTQTAPKKPGGENLNWKV